MVAVSYAGWRCAYPAYKTNLFLDPVDLVRRSATRRFFNTAHTPTWFHTSRPASRGGNHCPRRCGAVQGEGGRAGSMVAVSYAGWRCAYPAYKTNLFLDPVGRVRRSRHPAFFNTAHTPTWFHTSRPASRGRNRARCRTASCRRTAGWRLSACGCSPTRFRPVTCRYTPALY
ncbi:Uncharacterised protein [Enterobacter hormaechei]|nr:Uncharacterised protein [Enterobacter hormaechei]